MEVSASGDRVYRRRRGLRRAGSAAVAVVALVLVAGGCSGGSSGKGVVSVGAGAHSSAPAADPAQSGSPLAFSKCMRSHGVPNFPDPDAKGMLQINTQSGVDPNSAQFKSAQEACKSLMPAVNPGQNGNVRAAALKFAECMRSHGVGNFPDPDPQGGIQLGPNNGLDPQSATFQNAQKACQHLFAPAAGGPGGGGS